MVGHPIFYELQVLVMKNINTKKHKNTFMQFLEPRVRLYSRPIVQTRPQFGEFFEKKSVKKNDDYFFSYYLLKTISKHHVSIKHTPIIRLIINKSHGVITFSIFQNPLNQWSPLNLKYEINTQVTRIGVVFYSCDQTKQ